MANPTNSVDIYDVDFDTTHALMLVEKQDKVGRESTPAQQDQIAGEHIGNFYDDVIKGLRDQGFLPKRYVDATGDASPSAQTVKTIADASVVRMRLRAWGKVGANDFVYREMVRRYERDGGTVLTQIDLDSGNLYSAGGTLTTASVTLVVSGSNVQVQVTGEAATTIAWQLYVDFLEAHT